MTLPTLSPIITELCNHLWQSTLFAAAIAILALALRRYPARVRYWLWLTASAKFLIPFSLLIAVGTHIPLPRHATQPLTTYIAIDEISQPFTEFTHLQPPPRPTTPEPPPTHKTPTLPTLLAAVWLTGLLTVLTSWLIQWRRITNTLRTATPLRTGRELQALRHLEQHTGASYPIQILASPTSLEPGVFGILRPVLLWPTGLSPHLDDAHLEAVLAHELCHIRRRDNLTSALHMLVEAIFWFHPLVWWIESRLVVERERACDEDVVRLCNQPQVYAESILKVCELCIESPLTCVSGITGADLKKRIAQIMRNSVTRKLTFAAKSLLGASALAAIAAPILLGQMKGPRIVAAVKASAHAAAGAMSFAARVWSPIEPESSSPSDSLIALPSAREFQMKEPIKLPQVEAAFAQTSKQPLTNADVSRATVQQFLGFEDQSSTKLTGWFTNPSKTVSADDRVVHAGRWSARLQRDAQSTWTHSVITRSLPLDFQGHVVELRGYLRIQDVSDFAGLWLGEDIDGQMIELENMDSQQVKGTRDWAQYRITLPINPRAKQLDFGALVVGTGTLWTDDLELLVDGKPIAEAPNRQPPTNTDVTSASAPVDTCSWPTELKTTAENLNFADGAVGAPPKDWLIGQGYTPIPIYEAVNVPAEQCDGSQQCATVHSLRGDGRLAFLYQNLDVTQHRGQTLIYRAYVRVDSNQKSVARLLVHLHRKDCSSAFRDDMGDHPITSGDWTRYEIRAPIAKDAYQMEFGVQLIGQGAAWIDHISMEYAPLL